jgi:hypothetical protein
MFFVKRLKSALVIVHPASQKHPDKKIIRATCDLTTPGTHNVASWYEAGSGSYIRPVTDCLYELGKMAHIGCEIDVVITYNFPTGLRDSPVEGFPPPQALIIVKKMNVRILLFVPAYEIGTSVSTAILGNNQLKSVCYP